MSFNKTYFLLFVLLFLIEACIALFIKDGFIRHTFGDFLVVILIYCFIKTFIDVNPKHVAVVTLFIAFYIEFMQLTDALKWLGLEDNYFARLIFGTSFHFTDLLAYTIGILLALFIEYKRPIRLWNT